MKETTIKTISIALIVTAICAVDCLTTSLYWRHEAIIHHAAFYETSSWGNSSFHWNDVSFAQTPFQQ
jgi:hypothetical protein